MGWITVVGVIFPFSVIGSLVFILCSDLHILPMSFKGIASIIQHIIIDNCAKNAVVHILGKYSIYCWVISCKDFFWGGILGFYIYKKQTSFLATFGYILVCQGHHNKYHRLGCLSRNFFSVPEPRSLSWFLLRPLSLAGRQLSSLYVCMIFLCACLCPEIL